MEQDIASIRQVIRDIPNFPKPGIVFKDITPLLGDGRLFKRTIDILADRYRSQRIDTVLGIESRGFIIGAALAYQLGAGFCIVRKPVVIADDLLATGGTAAATAELVTKLGGTVVECAFVIELAFLKGRDRVKPYGVFSLVQYDSE